MSEFPASRRTVACRVERGGTVRDAVNWVRGDTKIKQKRNTNGSGGEASVEKAQVALEENALETISNLLNEWCESH